MTYHVIDVVKIFGDGPLEKWWGVGKKQKKIHATENAKKKNSCRRKVQLWFFQKVWVSLRKSEFQKSTILPGTIWINKNHFLLIERRILEPCICFNCSSCTYNIHCILYYNKNNKIKFVINKVWFSLVNEVWHHYDGLWERNSRGHGLKKCTGKQESTKT